MMVEERDRILSKMEREADILKGDRIARFWEEVLAVVIVVVGILAAVAHGGRAVCPPQIVGGGVSGSQTAQPPFDLGEKGKNP